MHRIWLTIIISITSIGFVLAQSESIVYASSHYRTSSGAIGPAGVIATHHFDIEVQTEETLILNELIFSSYKIMGNNLLMSPAKSGELKIEVDIIIYQKHKVWYTAKITFNDVTVPMDVIRERRNLSTEPAVILKVRCNLHQHDLHEVIKEKFDASSDIYNK